MDHLHTVYRQPGGPVGLKEAMQSSSVGFVHEGPPETAGCVKSQQVAAVSPKSQTTVLCRDAVGRERYKRAHLKLRPENSDMKSPFWKVYV